MYSSSTWLHFQSITFFKLNIFSHGELEQMYDNYLIFNEKDNLWRLSLQRNAITTTSPPAPPPPQIQLYIMTVS